MADRHDPDITGDSPQAVAFALLTIIARLEGRSLSEPSEDGGDWVLDTYGACLETVTGGLAEGEFDAAKIAQSDVPDTMLSLLTALRGAGTTEPMPAQKPLRPLPSRSEYLDNLARRQRKFRGWARPDMMTYLRHLGHYNAWANNRLFTACAALSDADLKADRKAFFGSIHGTLNHVLAVDRLWMERLTGKKAKISDLDTILYEDFAELRAAREAEDARIEAFVGALNRGTLYTALSYRILDGTEFETPIHLMLADMFNHATHHRGQAHALLSQVPADPPPLDLLYYLHDTGAASVS